VVVAIVNWNGRTHLETCLPAVSAQTYDDFEIVVVDNASSDGSVEWLRREWPEVRVIQAGDNVGFAAANNLAIAATTAPWVALLNNDTVPEGGWLAELVAAAEADSQIGSVASLMVFWDRPAVVNSAGVAVDPVGIAWDRLGGAAVQEAGEAGSVFGASAGAALYRRQALEDVALPASAGAAGDGRGEFFDGRYFMYLEDVDLAWRLRLRSWDCVYAPGARVLHRGSATAVEGSAFKNRLLARNKIWTVAKNYPTAPLLAFLPLIALYDLASAPYRLVVQGQTSALLGRLDALRDMDHVLRARRFVQSRRTARWADISAAMEPLEPPWAVLGRYRHLQGRGGT
jgi:GT2 family glycosyltransferase